MNLLIIIVFLGGVVSDGMNVPPEPEAVHDGDYYPNGFQDLGFTGPIVKTRAFKKAGHHQRGRANATRDRLETAASKLMAKYTEQTVSSAIAEFKCPRKNGVWPVFTNCGHYIQCVNGEPRERTCPSELHYNPASRECDFPNILMCPYQCPDPNGDFPLIGDCNSFVQCYNNIPQVKTCPGKLHWDKEKKQCEEPDVANCPLKCPAENGTFSYIEDCTSYILCQRGRAHLKKCPPGLFFSMSMRTCQPHMSGICLRDVYSRNLNMSVFRIFHAVIFAYGEATLDIGMEEFLRTMNEFQCQGETGRMPVIGNCKMFLECTRDLMNIVTVRSCPGELVYNYYTEQCEMSNTTVCVDACPSPNGIFPIPGLCNYYKICTNGVSEILMCPSGLHFNPLEKQCDEPSSAGCLPKCTKSGEVDGVPGRCNQYVECIEGVVKVKPCPIDLHFNQLLHVCDVPANSGCEYICPEKDGFFPIPGKCEEYYQCTNGTAIHQRCPSKLFFNYRIKMCDYPENSRCASVCPKSEGFFPVDGDCSAYVKCDNFVPTIVRCDEGHFFNILTSDCEVARNTSCEPKCPSPNGRFLIPGETNETFIECINNKPTIRSCSLGLQMNPEAENCE